MTMNLQNIAVVGSSGAIGGAFVQLLSQQFPDAELHSFSRSQDNLFDYTDEASIAEAADTASKRGPLDLVIVATGILHDGEITPEKSLKDLSAEKFHRLFEANTITPALIAKHFLPTLNRTRPSRFAALSARVGSISDNQLGGWYAYRASKAALNMVIKTAAIETGRRNRQAIVVGLHPGTVESTLSLPFQANVANGKLFTPDYAAQKLLDVLETLTPDHSSKCFAWDGKEILP